MKKIGLSTMILLAVGFTACTNQNDADSNTQMVDHTAIQTTEETNNLVSIVEIPVANFSRAVQFYQSILDIKVEEIDMQGTQMGIFPSDGKAVNVVLVRGDEYKPSIHGTLVYLNDGNDLQMTLDKIESSGGKVLVPKTEISPEMGFFAMFTDSEGNKLGLHSSH